MNRGTEDLIRRYFNGEVERVVVPPVPERPGIRHRIPAVEALLAAAACLCVIYTSSLQVPPSALVQKATDFARTREVGKTITRGLENTRRVVYSALVQGEDK